MIFSLKCKCGATATHKGHEEEDTNGAWVDTDEPIGWEGGLASCEHEDYEIIHSEYEDSEETW